MSLKTTFRLFSLAFITSLLVACGGSKVYDYVPEDATFAFKANVQTLWDKSFDDNESALKKIVNAIEYEIADERENEWGNYYNNMLDIAENFLKDPDVIGVDFSSPIVLSCVADFDDNDFDGYLSFILDDSEAFLRLVNAAYKLECETLSEYSSNEPSKFSFGEKEGQGFIFPSERFGVAVEEDAAVIVFPDRFGENGKNAKKLLTNLFEQENTCQAPGFDKFASANYDITAWVDYEQIYSVAKKEAKRELGPYSSFVMGYLPDVEGLYTIMGLNFEKGKVVLTSEFDGNDEFVDAMTSYYESASNIGFKYLPKNAAMVFNVALNSDAFVDLWEEQKEGLLGGYIKELEAQGLTTDVIRGLPGVVCGAVDADSFEEDLPWFTIFAEFDEDTYKLIKSVLEDYAGFEQEAKDVYNYRQLYVIFKKDGILLMDAETYDQTGGNEPRNNFNDSKIAKSIADGGVAFDFNALPEDILEEFADEMELNDTRALLDFASSVSVTYDANTFEATLEMGDQNTNMLQKAAKILANLIENEYN